MPPSSEDNFSEFAREWGGVLAQDGTASLDRLLDEYVHLASPAECADTACECSAASMEDFTDIWAASKRANKEWEAACMVRSIRRCIVSDLTRAHLVLAMLCWACTQRQQAQRFFKACHGPVRALIHEVVQRCSAVPAGEDAGALADAALYVSLQLLGWHDSVLLGVQRCVTHAAPPQSEADVLLLVCKAAQDLSPAFSPRGHSVDSTPGITTTRTSAVSSASDQEAPASLLRTVTARPTAPPTTGPAAKSGDAAAVRSGPAARRPAGAAAAAVVPLPRDRLERARVVDGGAAVSAAALTAPPARPPPARTRGGGPLPCAAAAAPTRRSSATTSASNAAPSTPARSPTRAAAFKRLETAPPMLSRSPARRPEGHGTATPSAAAAVAVAPNRRRSKQKRTKEDANCAVL